MDQFTSRFVDRDLLRAIERSINRYGLRKIWTPNSAAALLAASTWALVRSIGRSCRRARSARANPTPFIPPGIITSVENDIDFQAVVEASEGFFCTRCSGYFVTKLPQHLGDSRCHLVVILYKQHCT